MITNSAASSVTRADVEEFLYEEAALLDAWRLDDWLALMTGDAVYRVPSNDQPNSDPKDTLFIVADDIHRIHARVARLKKKDAHAEDPRSRTRRLLTNVRVVERNGNALKVEANFSVTRFRRNDGIRTYIGHYRYELRVESGSLKIAKREAVIDSMELGGLGSISFIL